MTTKPRHAYRPDIDGLRALAVLSVVIGHFFSGRLPGGFIGVDVFFVISGYLITGIILEDLQHNRFTFASFYARRFRRILPALAIVLLAVWVVGWLLFFGDDYLALGKHVAAGAAFVSNILLWQETGYFDKAAELKPLLHLWSLGIEEQFYLAWPMLLVLWYRKGWSVTRLIGVIALVSFLINVVRVNMHGAEAFYLLPSRFWELLVGGGLAYAESQRQSLAPNPFADLKAFVAAGLFGFALFFTSGAKPYPGWWALLPVLSALLFISAGQGAWLNRHVLACRPALFVGLISYPLYLWHWPLLSISRITRSAASASPLLRLSLMVLAFILAWATWKWLDRPIRKRFPNGWIEKNKKKLLATSFASIALVCFLGVMMSQGRVLSPEQEKTIQFVKAYSGYSETFSRLVRAGKCHLETVDASDFNPICYERHSPPTIALFGDSHASHLYPGLKDYFGKDASIMQLSRGCPPLLRVENNAICERSAEFVKNILMKAKPDVLILSGLWSNYDSDPSFIGRLNETVFEARALGVKNVVVIGKFPTWTTTLYKVMAENYLHSGKRIPSRATDGLVDDSRTQREFARNFANLPVHYLPIAQKLCNQDGCMVMVGDNVMTDLISFDNGHLTEAGSKYVVTNFIGPFIQNLVQEQMPPAVTN